MNVRNSDTTHFMRDQRLVARGPSNDWDLVVGHGPSIATAIHDGHVSRESSQSVGPELMRDGMSLAGLHIVGNTMMERSVDTLGRIHFFDNLTDLDFSGVVVSNLVGKTQLQLHAYQLRAGDDPSAPVVSVRRRVFVGVFRDFRWGGACRSDRGDACRGPRRMSVMKSGRGCRCMTLDGERARGVAARLHSGAPHLVNEDVSEL